MFLKEMIQVIIRFPKHIRRKRSLERQIVEIINEDSYFPEFERKDRLVRKKENRKWVKLYGEANHYYNLYGLDIVGVDQDKYLDSHAFIAQRNKNNYRSIDENQITCLRDKFVFYTYMKAKGLPVADIIAIYRNHSLFDIDWNEIPIDSVADLNDYFVKDMFGKNGSNVYHITDYDDLLARFDFNTTGTYIFQRRIVQSKEMDKVYCDSLNTLRIVTVNNNGKTDIFAATLKCGTQKSDAKDNWSLGSLAVGINDDGTLKQFGFYKSEFGTKAAIHPDSGLEFSSFRIPDYSKVKEVVIRAHKYLYNIHSIGWDVAITDAGPIIIEGNDNWGIALLQAPHGSGLKHKWNELQPTQRV